MRRFRCWRYAAVLLEWLTGSTPDRVLRGTELPPLLVRAHITLQNVAWEQVPGTWIAHVRIAAFSQGVTDDLKEALREIQQEGLGGIILDLRSNPDGLLSEAIGVASQFLVDGNVLLEKDTQGTVKPVPVLEGGLAPNLPLVVLIDAGTASAAEIVSGALQDAGGAELVGETSFGTGTVLNEFALSDGSALLLATEEWLTPDGRTIWHQGIAPDAQVILSHRTGCDTPSPAKCWLLVCPSCLCNATWDMRI